MRNVVAIDRGTHWEVIADYSGSPRHAAFTPSQWAAEYASGYEMMRQSQPGSVAMTAPQGIGKWKKDWSGPFIPS